MVGTCLSRRSLLGAALAIPWVCRGLRALAAEARCPIPIHSVAGTPQEIAAAYAKALGPTAKTLVNDYLKKFLPGKAYGMALQAGRLFERFISEPHLAELKALAREADIAGDDLLLGNVFVDLIPTAMCSTITLGTQACGDHLPRMGRNLDFPGLGVAEKRTIVVVFRPEKRHAFAAVTWPGLLGVLSGMNAKGLCAANMEVPRGLRAASGMPCMFLYRTVMEQCSTVDEAIDLLKQSSRHTANNLMLLDAGGRRAVAELTPDKVVVRQVSDDKPLVATNHQRGADSSTTGRCRRYDALNRLSAARWGAIDVSEVERMLNAASASLTIQSMVFEPTTLKVHLSTGVKAAGGPFHELDLSGSLK